MTLRALVLHHACFVLAGNSGLGNWLCMPGMHTTIAVLLVIIYTQRTRQRTARGVLGNYAWLCSKHGSDCRNVQGVCTQLKQVVTGLEWSVALLQQWQQHINRSLHDFTL